MKEHKHMRGLAILVAISLLFSFVILIKVYAEDKKAEKEITKKQTDVPAENIKPPAEIEEERTIVEEKEVKEVLPTFHTSYPSTDLNIRTEPHAKSNIHAAVKVNTELQVFDNFDENGWKKIIYDDKELYVNGKYLSDKPVEIKKKPIQNKPVNTEKKRQSNNFIGKFKITHYAEHNTTATGTTPRVGRTIAVDPNVIPYGSRVIINGHTYVAEDCGGAVKGNVIDIFVGSTEEAYQKGVYYTEVYWG